MKPNPGQPGVYPAAAWRRCDVTALVTVWRAGGRPAQQPGCSTSSFYALLIFRKTRFDIQYRHYWTEPYLDPSLSLLSVVTLCHKSATSASGGLGAAAAVLSNGSRVAWEAGRGPGGDTGRGHLLSSVLVRHTLGWHTSSRLTHQLTH